jgi:hypothetical protein
MSTGWMDEIRSKRTAENKTARNQDTENCVLAFFDTRPNRPGLIVFDRNGTSTKAKKAYYSRRSCL